MLVWSEVLGQGDSNGGFGRNWLVLDGLGKTLLCGTLAANGTGSVVNSFAGILPHLARHLQIT